MQLDHIAIHSLATVSNLKRLKGMATLICELNLDQAQAALLIHSGVSSVSALAALSPQELANKTGRLERQLNTGRIMGLDLVEANALINNAKYRLSSNHKTS